MFRLMVRSFEGSYFYNMGWYRREVWSTWSHYDTEEAARVDAAGFGQSLIPFAVITESEYPFFCSAHRMG